MAGGFAAAGAVVTGATAAGAVLVGAVEGRVVPVVRGTGVAAVGWANVVSVAARSVLLAWGATVVAALLSGAAAGTAVVVVDTPTDEVEASSTVGADAVPAGAAAAGAAC